jgi:hypothetical protein
MGGGNDGLLECGLLYGFLPVYDRTVEKLLEVGGDGRVIFGLV